MPKALHILPLMTIHAPPPKPSELTGVNPSASAIGLCCSFSKISSWLSPWGFYIDFSFAWGVVIWLTHFFLCIALHIPPYHLRLFQITQYEVSTSTVPNFPFYPSYLASYISIEFITLCLFLYSLAYFFFFFSSIKLRHLSSFSLMWN